MADITQIKVSGTTYTIKDSNALRSHPSITQSNNTTSTASPGSGGTFTVIDSITKDSNGHVTKYNTKTVTMPTVSSGSGGTTDYSALTNKPSINGVTLSGNKTSANLGLASSDHTHNNYMVEPSSEGTAGQVLMTDGSGGRSWGSGSGTSDINIKKWFGKKIVVDGSSITKGGNGETQPTWSDYLKDMFLLSTVYNHAVSGTGWFFGGGSYVVDRVDAYESDANCVILMGDYNGIYAYTQEVGTIDDEVSTSNTGSYYARLKYLAEKLINKYPLCPIIWVIEPPRASVGQTDGGKTPMEYNSTYALQSKCIEEVAEYYGFAHCNLM